MNKAYLTGTITSIAFLSPTHNELRMTVKSGTANVVIVISDKQTIDFAQHLTLGEEVAITGRLGSESTVHSLELTTNQEA